MGNGVRALVVLGLAFGLVVGAPGVSRAGDSLALEACKLDIGLGESVRQIDAQCGVAQVPEDWSKPDGPKLEIHVVVLPAANPSSREAPIFHLEGGPGGSAIRGFGQIWHTAYQAFREDHDIVLIDQRGTGRSASLQCHEFTEAAFDDLREALSAETEMRLSRRRYELCLSRLSEKTDPANYTSHAMADDTNAIRAALGYEKINIFGSSYGTWLGQVYLGRHGATVNGIILEGVVGPWNEPYLKAGANFETALNRVFERCQEDPACNAIYPDLPGKLKAALDRLGDKAVSVAGTSSLTSKTFPLQMTKSRLLEALRTMLNQGSLIASIPQAVAQAAAGVYTLPAAVVIANAEQMESISVGLFQSVVCAENIAFLTDETVREHLTGSYYGLGDDLIQRMIDACQVWRSAELDAAQVAPVTSDRPVLIFSGLFDPITPVGFAQETNSRLGSSTLAVFPYEGHGILPNNRCAQILAAQFFKAPDQPVDTSCTAQDVKTVFVGTYRTEYESYADPGGAFRLNIPKGWAVQPAEPGDLLTFFASPGEQALAQYLGVGVLKNQQADARTREAAEALLRRTFGQIDLQATVSSFGVSVSQYAVTAPDEIYIGALVTFAFGPDTRLIWYAAPNNAFSATFNDLVTQVITTLVSR